MLPTQFLASPHTNFFNLKAQALPDHIRRRSMLTLIELLLKK
jgi:hypothetical protein